MKFFIFSTNDINYDKVLKKYHLQVIKFEDGSDIRTIEINDLQELEKISQTIKVRGLFLHFGTNNSIEICD